MKNKLVDYRAALSAMGLSYDAESFLLAVGKGNNLPAVRLFVESGISVNEKIAGHDVFPLSEAAFRVLGDSSVLFSEGADINGRDPGNGGDALIYASMGGYLDVVKFLVDHGADMAGTVDRLGGLRGMRRSCVEIWI